MARYLWMPVAGLAVASMAIGLRLGQYDQVLRWAQTLCTSCIGLGR